MPIICTLKNIKTAKNNTISKECEKIFLNKTAKTSDITGNFTDLIMALSSCMFLAASNVVFWKKLKIIMPSKR
jgi:hypothetical protein